MTDEQTGSPITPTQAETVESLTDKLNAATAEAEKWKALSRKNEDRAKENAAAAEELERLREAGAPGEDAERAALMEAIADMVSESEKLELEVLRFKIADGKIPTADMALFLTGTDEDTIRKQAGAYLSVFNTPAARGPRPDHSQGGAAATGEHRGIQGQPANPLLDALARV